MGGAANERKMILGIVLWLLYPKMFAGIILRGSNHKMFTASLIDARYRFMTTGS
jgi:hypothetical protein